MKVELHAEFEVWLSELAESDLEVLADVVALLTALGEFGRGLGLPESKPIVSSRLDLFELRRTPPSSTVPLAVGSPVLRVLYGFCRNAADEIAVVVVGGDKTDKGNDWYMANVSKAEVRLVGWCREDGSFSPVERRKF